MGAIRRAYCLYIFCVFLSYNLLLPTTYMKLTSLHGREKQSGIVKLLEKIVFPIDFAQQKDVLPTDFEQHKYLLASVDIRRRIGAKDVSETVLGDHSLKQGLAEHQYVSSVNIIQKPKQNNCFDDRLWEKILRNNLRRTWSVRRSTDQEAYVECPYFNVSEINYFTPRMKFSLNCEASGEAMVSITLTEDSSDIWTVPFGDKCVGKYIAQCTGFKSVPNVVHYVWYRKGELTFNTFASILSVIRFVKPCTIIFHGDKIPFGKYWDYIVSLFPNIIHMKRILSSAPFGETFAYNEHIRDVARLEALLFYGGIYIDVDQLVVKSVAPYRRYPIFMSYLNNGLIGCFFTMAEKNATFLHLWLDGYRYYYNGSSCHYNTMVYPTEIAAKHKKLIHLENGTTSRPMDLNDVDLYDSKYGEYDWSSIYSIHLHSGIMNDTYDEYTIRGMKTIVGSISRYILYGNKELCY